MVNTLTELSQHGSFEYDLFLFALRVGTTLQDAKPL